MNANHELERRLVDFYASEAPQRAPDRVLEGVLASIDSTRQRRVLVRGPWRFPTMNTYAKVAVAAVAVVVIGAVGLAVLRPGTAPGVGGPPTTSPILSPVPSASASASPVAPPELSETFTSERHGFSISYPAGWVTRPATDAWTTSFPNFASTDGDVIYDPDLQDHLWIVVASQPQAGKAGELWVDDMLTGLSTAGLCQPPNERVAIDGGQGGKCASSVSAVAAGDRGYLIQLYVSDDEPAAGVTYDQEFFDELLATIRLIPEDAVDTTSSPTPSVSP
jgi:hypothetical protein